MADADDRGVRPEELGPDDVAALGWAVSTGHPLGVEIRDRARTGGPALTAGEVAVILGDWERAGRPVVEHHVHRTVVRFPDGTSVTGVSFSADDPYGRDSPPTFGLYLDHLWDPPWPHTHVAWPDFGVPADGDGLRIALADLLDRSRRGEAVEVGCLGGHGRTGTALACLAVLTGVAPDEAVAWVRSNYCPKAVETDEQQTFVSRFRP